MFEYRNGKELHIHLDDAPDGCFTTYKDTAIALEQDYDIIHTTIPHFCHWKYHRRIFIYINGVQHEITMGNCEGTNRRIKESSNIEKLLFAGEFEWTKYLNITNILCR